MAQETERELHLQVLASCAIIVSLVALVAENRFYRLA
jgi:hypothetical protein